MAQATTGELAGLDPYTVGGNPGTKKDDLSNDE